jgi:hypothetical protein
MTDLFQDNQQRTGEDPQAMVAIDEADGNAPALPASSSRLPTTESPDALGTPELLRRATDGTSETFQLYTQIKQMIRRRTLLPDSVSSLVAFWSISTWFQEAFTVFPCLVITGPAHEAMVVLRVLNEVCYAPILLAGLKRADLKDINRYRTLLISEQNLDARTAALVGNLTN